MVSSIVPIFTLNYYQDPIHTLQTECLTKAKVFVIQ